MGRVSDILLRSRRALSDTSASRWDDDTLIALLNDGLEEFISKTGVLKKRTYIKIETNIGLYDLSDSVFNIDRVQYKSQVLTAKTEEEMDRIDKYWEDAVGVDPKYIIFSNNKAGVFRMYPKIKEGTANIITQNQLYGGIIDIEVTDGLFNLPMSEEIETDLYKYLAIFYTAKPKTIAIDSPDEDIEIDTVHDKALAFYISGQALRYDADTLNRQFSAEQLQLFYSYVEASKNNEMSANNTFSRHTIPYRGFQ